MEKIVHQKVDRECGDCNLCCKLPNIDNGKFKKDYTWCKHCEIGVGCKIYPQRPKICKDFKCLWKAGMCDESLKPNKVGFYIIPENDQSMIDACFTIYAETYRVDNIPKIMGDMDLVDQDNRVWRYVIRYNENEDDLALYDKHRFGNRLIYGKRGDIL